MRLLIVEDQAELRQSLAQRSCSDGYSVDEAGDLETAQLLLQTHDFVVPATDSMRSGRTAKRASRS